MSDPIHHECGIAVVRLRRPLEYFQDRHKDALWGLRKLWAMMEKQRNRGHDGVGLGCCKLDPKLGRRYLFATKTAKRDALNLLFGKQFAALDRLSAAGLVKPHNPASLKQHFDFAGEVLFGHLRYSTSGGSTQSFCHPQVRESNWRTKSLMVMGNFNLTNVRDLRKGMTKRGQHPFYDTDTQVILEEIGYHLEEKHDELYRKHRDAGVELEKIPDLISEELDMVEVIRAAAVDWDGGYTLAGVVGNGDMFVMRDPNGIRPCFYYIDDEIIAFASERPPLMTVLNKPSEQIHELERGHVATIKSTGEFRVAPFTDQRESLPCSFERIYFSRGNDPDIYRERKELGRRLVKQVWDAIGGDLNNTVFTFIPNTAETGYLGLMDGLRERRRCEVHDKLTKAASDRAVTQQLLDELIQDGWPRGEKILYKDEKFRTFISNETGRKEMVSLAYDISHGVIKPTDTVVAVDDSIVRGTTLRESVIKILSRVNPKKIIIVSTAPQIRYPDCYAIDMSQLGKFLAFDAAIKLLKKAGRTRMLDDLYHECRGELLKPTAEARNCVRDIYKDFEPEEISAEMARLVTPEDIPWRGEVQLIFETIENLHAALPNHRGDWYFTGNYPTPGGNAVANQAYVNYVIGEEGRPYDTW